MGEITMFQFEKYTDKKHLFSIETKFVI